MEVGAPLRAPTAAEGAAPPPTQRLRRYRPRGPPVAAQGPAPPLTHRLRRYNLSRHRPAAFRGLVTSRGGAGSPPRGGAGTGLRRAADAPVAGLRAALPVARAGGGGVDRGLVPAATGGAAGHRHRARSLHPT